MKTVFAGFDKKLFKFFNDLEKNNNIDWFHKNKPRYNELLVEPSKSLVIELAPFLNRLNPAIRSEPKFNQTLMRINKDMRFAKNSPYKNYFLINFGRFKMDSEFYIYFDAKNVQIGVFLNNSSGPNLFFKKNLKKYRQEITEIFDQYKLNNRYSLYTIEKSPELILKKFSAPKHFEIMESLKYILLQKTTDSSWQKIYSSQFVIEIIKMISALYPLYCFAISTNPIRELEKFEDNIGTIL